MGLNKSKYDIDRVTTDTIKDVILSYYESLPSVTFGDADIPINIYQQQERIFRIRRESTCHFLEFENPKRNQLVYDFIINGKKVQEKVGNVTKNKEGILFCLYKNNGCRKKPRTFISYTHGDNDFYWLNCPDKNHFYVIPEYELIQRNKIGTGKSESIYFNPSNTDKWAFEYLFDYTNLDIEKLTNMFI